MREIYNDNYYRIIIDGEIEELDHEDLMKIYAKCEDSSGNEKEFLIEEIGFLDDAFDLIKHLINEINFNKMKG